MGLAAHHGGMRVAAGFIVFHDDGEKIRFLLLRNSSHGTWSFPKGHLEEGESIEGGARRELLEETGIADLAVIPGFHAELRYLVPPGKRAASDGKRPGYEKTLHLFLGEVSSPSWKRSDEHDDGGFLTSDMVRARLQHKDLRGAFDRAAEVLSENGRRL